MILLSTTITLSIELQTLIIFSLFLIIVSFFIYLNTLKFEKFEEITRYKNHRYDKSYDYLDNCLRFCGLIFVPLFKQTIIDARYFIYLKTKEEYYHQDVYMISDEDSERKIEKLKFERGLKLLKLKYKRKNFVVRKVFTIFVSK